MAAKKPDLISAKARSLSEEIAALEAEIKRLDTQLAKPAAPKFRTTVMPAGTAESRPIEKPAPPMPKPEPVFENLKRNPLATAPEPDHSEMYNDLGLRRYDLPALWHRLRNHLRGPTTSNPRLVNYLASGGVHGLRPLRYEKRVARNRVIVLTVIFFVILLGILSFYWRDHR